MMSDSENNDSQVTEGEKPVLQLESVKRPLINRKRFFQRVFVFSLIAIGQLVVSLLIGILGYHYWGHLPWIDSLLNASMILGGMGPVDILQSNGAKIFASIYAIYAGMILLSSFGLFIAPLAHRILHRMHLNTKST